MATVNRPPFWVPRPSDDPPWNPPPVRSPIIAFLTQQKVFGAGGEVWTKKWLPHYTENEPQEWLGTPLNSGAIQVTKTQQKIFGQPGQSPTKWWMVYGTENEPQEWLGTPTRSIIIPILSSQRMFGAGGQVPPFRWNYTYDDPPPWQPASETLNSLTLYLPAATPKKPYWGWPNVYDDTPSWYPISGWLNSGAVTLTRTQAKFFGQPGQIPSFRWNATYDDSSSWQWPLYERNRNVLFTVTAPLVYPPIQWYSEDALWLGAPVRSGAIQVTTTQVKFYGQPGQSPTKAYAPWLAYDDPPPWQPAAQNLNSLALYLPSSSPPRATFSLDPRLPFTYDDASFWQGTPTAYNANFFPTVPVNIVRAPFYFSRPASEEIWVGAPVAYDHNFLPSVQNPFSFRLSWPYTHDETPPWQVDANSLNSAVIQNLSQPKIFGQGGQVPPFRWNYTLDDASTWQWPLYERSRVLGTVQSPLVYPPIQWYSEDAFWLGSSLSSRAIIVTTTQGKFYGQPGQSVPFRWNYTIDDASTWQWPPYERNANVLIPGGQSPFSNRQGILYDETAPWQWPSYTATIFPLSMQLYVPAGIMSFSYDDPPTWQWVLRVNKNVTIPPPPPPFSNRQTWWNLDDHSSWSGSPLRSYSVVLTTTQAKIYGQPGQAPPFRWNATYDDSSLWSWTGATRNRNALLPTIPPLVYPPAQWYSEDAFWQGAPLSSRAIVATTTQAKFYGQPGQVPPFRWNHTYDDPPPHRQTTPNAAVISLLTAAQLPGLPPGAAPARFYKFDYDEASTWWPKNRLVTTLIFPIIVPPPGPAARVVSSRTLVGMISSRTLVTGVFSVTAIGREISTTTIGGIGH